MVRIFKRAQCAGSQSQHAGSNFGLFGNRLTGWILPVGNKLAIWNAIVNGCAQGSFHWPCFCCKIVFLLYTSLMGCDPQQNQFYDVEGKGDELERRDPSDSSSSRGSQTRKTPSLVIFHTIHIGTMYIYIYIYLFICLFIYLYCRCAMVLSSLLNRDPIAIHSGTMEITQRSTPAVLRIFDPGGLCGRHRTHWDPSLLWGHASGGTWQGRFKDLLMV